MTKVELLPTRDYEAGYAPMYFIPQKKLHNKVKGILVTLNGGSETDCDVYTNPHT